MKKSILFLLLTGFIFSYSFGQEETKPAEESIPVTTFESNYVVDDQTTTVFDQKTFGIAIQHKFGTIENGISDLFGIYGAGKNIRLGMEYVPIKNLQVGIGVTKGKMYTDLNAKYRILQQTSDNKMPVSLAVYGVLAIDGRNESTFGKGKVSHPGEGSSEFEITFTDKWSYFSQLMVSRKFAEWLSVQAAVSFTHYNMVEQDQDHDLVGLHGLAKVKISPQSSFTFNYNAPLEIQSISEQTKVPDYTPNMAIGWQISTYTHAFHIYLSNSPGMLPMDNMMYNTAKFNKEGIAIGFTITRLWAF